MPNRYNNCPTWSQPVSSRPMVGCLGRVCPLFFLGAEAGPSLRCAIFIRTPFSLRAQSTRRSTARRKKTPPEWLLQSQSIGATFECYERCCEINLSKSSYAYLLSQRAAERRNIIISPNATERLDPSCPRMQCFLATFQILIVVVMTEHTWEYVVRNLVADERLETQIG